MSVQRGIGGGKNLVDVMGVNSVSHSPPGSLVRRNVGSDKFGLFEVVEQLAEVGAVGGPFARGEGIDDLPEIEGLRRLRKDSQEAQLRPTPAEGKEVVNPCVIHSAGFLLPCRLYEAVNEGRADFKICLACLRPQVLQPHEIALGHGRIEGHEVHCAAEATQRFDDLLPVD